MAFVYTDKLQDRISLAVWNVQRSSLSAVQKLQLDQTWTTGSLLGGAAYDAFNELAQLAQWFERDASVPDTSFPQDEWDRVFVAKAAMILVKTVRPERYQSFVADHNAAVESLRETFTKTTIAGAWAGAASTMDGWRTYIINHSVRRKFYVGGVAKFLIPQVEDIDSHIQWVINFVWNIEPWNFRKRMIQITINANNTVSMTGLSSETFDSIASNKLFYDGSYYGEELQWVDSTAAPALKAKYGTSTGQPVYFRTEVNGSTVTWHLFPIPDQAYTLYGSVYVATPSVTSAATLATAIGKFPPEFATVLRDMVLARVLLQYNAQDADRMWERCEEQVRSFGPIYTDTGMPAKQTSIADVYGDWVNTFENAGGGGAYGFIG